jgi:CHC2 zinc finger
MRPHAYATDREPNRNGIRRRWVIGQYDRCNTGSLDYADEEERPPTRTPERKRHLTVVPPPTRRDGSHLPNLRSIPSAEYVPLLTGRHAERGMVRCPWHADGEERTPSLHVLDDDGGWFCHGCSLSGGIFEFCCALWDRALATGGRDFARLIDEVHAALRRAT